MSLSCDAIQLVVVDVDGLGPATVPEIAMTVVNAGMRLGAISTRGDLGRRLNSSTDGARFDFWIPGENDTYQFGRLSAIIDTEPGHILIVTSNEKALAQAQSLGLRTLDPDIEDIMRVLT